MGIDRSVGAFQVDGCFERWRGGRRDTGARGCGGGGDALARRVVPLGGDGLELEAISNRGTKVGPGGSPETFCTDHWCCRFLAPDGRGAVSHEQVAALLARCARAGLDFIKTEGLFTFDGERGYSAGGE